MLRAAGILQKFALSVKDKSTKHLVKEMIGCGLTVANIQNSMTLADFASLARNAKVIQTTKLAFQRIHKLAVLITTGAADHDPPTRFNIRYFLAAYMLVCFPGE